MYEYYPGWVKLARISFIGIVFSFGEKINIPCTLINNKQTKSPHCCFSNNLELNFLWFCMLMKYCHISINVYCLSDVWPLSEVVNSQNVWSWMWVVEHSLFLFGTAIVCLVSSDAYTVILEHFILAKPVVPFDFFSHSIFNYILKHKTDTSMLLWKYCNWKHWWSRSLGKWKCFFFSWKIY